MKKNLPWEYTAEVGRRYKEDINPHGVCVS